MSEMKRREQKQNENADSANPSAMSEDERQDDCECSDEINDGSHIILLGLRSQDVRSDA